MTHPSGFFGFLLPTTAINSMMHVSGFPVRHSVSSHICPHICPRGVLASQPWCSSCWSESVGRLSWIPNILQVRSENSHDFTGGCRLRSVGKAAERPLGSSVWEGVDATVSQAMLAMKWRSFRGCRSPRSNTQQQGAPMKVSLGIMRRNSSDT